MGEKSNQYNKKQLTVECKVCDGTILLEPYVARGDMIHCDECESNYIIKSRNPVQMVLLIKEDIEEEYDEDDDLYDGRGYD